MKERIHFAPRRHEIAFNQILVFVLLLTIFPTSLTYAVTKTWTNGGGDNLWSNSANWSPAGVPGALDLVQFDGTSSANCIMNVSPVIKSLTAFATYTGQIIQGSVTLTVEDGFSIATSTQYDAGTGLVKFAANTNVNSAASIYDLEILGNGFVSLLQDLNITHNLTLTSVFGMPNNDYFLKVGGDLVTSDNDGWMTGGNDLATVISLVGSTDQTITSVNGGIIARLDVSKSGGNVLLATNVLVSELFTGTAQSNIVQIGGMLQLSHPVVGYLGIVNDVEFVGGAITLTSDFIISGNLTITNAGTYFTSQGNVKVYGNLIVNGANGWNGTALYLIGNTDQTISGNSGRFTSLNINKTGGNVLMAVNVQIISSLTGTSQASMLNSGGILIFLNPTVGYAGIVEDLKITAGITLTDDLNVTGDLTLSAGIFTLNGSQRKIKVSGNIINDDNGWGGDAIISLVGSTNQTISGSGGQFNILDISKSGGDVEMAANVTVTNTLTGTAQANMINSGGMLRIFNTTLNYAGTVQDAEITSFGTITLNSDLNISGNLTVINVAQFSNEFRLKVSGNLVYNDSDGWNGGNNTGAIISMVGTGAQNISGSGWLSRFELLKSSGTLSLNSFSGNFVTVVLATGNTVPFSFSGNTFSSNTWTINGGAIGGSGTVIGPVTCNAGGGISPGSPIGCLTFNSAVTLNSGSTYQVEIDNTGTACSDFDQITVSQINYGGTLSVIFNNAPMAGQSYQIAVPTNINGDFSSINVTPSGVTCSYNRFTGILTVTASPFQTWYEDADGDGYGNSSVSLNAISQPSGYVADNADCDDGNAAVHPGATEVCNGIDDNCDGSIDEGVQSEFFADADGDGYGNPAVSLMACTAPGGYVADNTDCDDGNAAVHPGATEVCNGIDDDCDGSIDEDVQSEFFADADGDGYGNPAISLMACTAPGGYVADNTDCDDANAAVHPGATEVCNGIDDNCDGTIDEGVQSEFFADADGDGYGDPAVSIMACTAPGGYVADNTDCDDTNPAVHPGATEVCNGIDDNCDGSIDEGVQSEFFADADGDGYGDPAVSIMACTAPGGYVADNTDCDDTDAAVHPGATEICNGIDDNCDGSIDEGVQSLFFADADGDGYGNPAVSIMACTAPGGYVANNTDCDDTDATVHPGATEVCNGIDDNCDGSIDEGVQSEFFADADGDGYGNPAVSITACTAPGGYVADNTDCDDTNAAVHPGATEVCNGIDDDCDGSIDEGVQSLFFADADGDGYGDPAVSIMACTAPGGYVADNTDCDDTNAAVHPGATEVCNGIDDDCDGSIDEGVQFVFFADADGDGFGDPAVSILACFAPSGYVADNTDCDDSNFFINPLATEVCNGIDDDCDGLIDDEDPDINGQITWFVDNDGDGYGDPANSIVSCNQPEGYVANDNDCDDNNALVNPGMTEECNGIDDDCDGITDEDCNAPVTVDAGECQIVYSGYEPLACTTLNAVASGGVAPYSFTWSNGMTGASIEVCPNISQIYTVTVTDAFGTTATDGVTAEVVNVQCGNNNNKVLVCHNGNNTLCISSSAVQDHLDHGDYLGTCGTEPCVSGNGNGQKIVSNSDENHTTGFETRMRVYPNPAMIEIFVTIEGQLLEGSFLEITDLMGKKVRRIDASPVSGEVMQIDLAGLTSGTYILCLSSNGNMFARQLITVIRD